MAPVGSRHASRHQATVMEKEERWERERESREENEQIRGMPRRRPQEEISASLKSWGDRKRHTGNREQKEGEEGTEVLRLHSPA